MSQISSDIIAGINQSLEISLPVTVSPEELKEKLAAHINHLINHDFEKLVYYLYRIDVNETSMRDLLEQEKGENAPGLIAELIIERHLQKIKSRQQFNQRDNDINEDEKW
ncbi:MAG: hypothetical protein H7Y01_01795 [Ferruginibacter sp.]|nr:hypothetical protein [Chitinophagaceae bacterium]